jgi:predicted enzyme related to lactoylglutathione lyase
MKITEIAFTCFPVTDMSKSRAFYEGLLNLKPSTQFGSPSEASEWTEYEIGGGAFAIGRHSSFKTSPDGASIAFEVEDFDKAVQQLKEAEVTFKIEPTETPVCRMAMIFDPDGSIVCIHKSKTQAATNSPVTY